MNRAPSSRLYRLEEKKLRVVFEAIVATSTNSTELTPILAPDGATLTLRDRAEGACPGALEESRAKMDHGVQPPELDKAVRAACNALGIYEWDGTRYVRKR